MLLNIWFSITRVYIIVVKWKCFIFIIIKFFVFKWLIRRLLPQWINRSSTCRIHIYNTHHNDTLHMYIILIKSTNPFLMNVIKKQRASHYTWEKRKVFRTKKNYLEFVRFVCWCLDRVDALCVFYIITHKRLKLLITLKRNNEIRFLFKYDC